MRNDSGEGVCTSGVRLWIRSCDLGARGKADIGNLGVTAIRGRMGKGMWSSFDQQTLLTNDHNWLCFSLWVTLYFSIELGNSTTLSSAWKSFNTSFAYSLWICLVVVGPFSCEGSIAPQKVDVEVSGHMTVSTRA